MTDRYEPLPPSQLTSAQREAHDEAKQMATTLFGNKFVFENKDGALIGPFPPLIHTPTLLDPFVRLVVELGKLPGLPAKAKETAILATGSVYKAGYELYAHEKIAESAGVLNKHQIDAIKQGMKPEGEHKLDEQEEVAFDVTIELARGGGPLGHANWNRAVQCFGKQGAAALIQYVGVYAYICILLNGVDAAVPE